MLKTLLTICLVIGLVSIANSDVLPRVEGAIIYAVEDNGVTVIAVINTSEVPGQLALDAVLEIGENEFYGIVIPLALEPRDRTGVVISKPIQLTGLNSGTTYHYRISVKYANTEIHSFDDTFSTSGEIGARKIVI